MIARLLTWLGVKPERHYPLDIAGNFTLTCKCGHTSPWDYDLRKHFEETGRIGK